VILGITTPHTPPQGEQCDQRCSNKKNKMLASTMQFSNNNPHPIHQPTRPASQDTETRNNNPNPHRSGCLLFQDPTVCQHQLAATNTTHSNHTRKGMTYSSTAGTTTGTIH
ncbi:hypothetical protein, partial [Micrococcus luteus]|uniref:hypothetical protein n=3 Tax=Micrococcus TaxID=1269 RepID=UPI001AA05E5B